MNREILIRSYRGSDEAALLQLWNASLPADRIDARTFRTQVLLDANFLADGLLVAEEPDGTLSGFVLSLSRQVPLFLQGLEPERGWITAFGVHPARQRRGIGRRLFEAALARLAGLGCQRVQISPYTPNYFTPGVDMDAYAGAVAFLAAQGFRTISEPISMQVDLSGFQVPAAIGALEQQLAETQAIVVRPVTSADLPELLPFVARVFGWDWYRMAQEQLLALYGAGADDREFLVALRQGRIVGYCQQRRERFGPFGVEPSLRSQGIGRILLFRCLEAMRARNFRCAWFLWTGVDAARLYQQAGFQQVRRFAVVEREL